MTQTIKIKLPYKVKKSNTNITAIYSLKQWQSSIKKIYGR